MEIKNKLGTDEFEVLGDSGIIYRTTFTSCSCPVYMFRGRKICKHIQFILNNISKKDTDINTQIIELIRVKGEVSFIDLEKKFGKDIFITLDKLEQQAELYHDKIYDIYRIFE